MKNKQPIPKGTELKTIPDYPSHKISLCGKYIVSDKGKVITQAIQTIKGKPTGYIYATLCSPTYYKRIAVHRLVAFAWLPAPPSDKHTWINHKDGDKGNNHYSNLEWTTISQNIKHAFDTGLKVAKKGEAHHMFGVIPSEQTKLLMSEAKRGTKHPKFKGFYICNGQRFESATQAGKVLGLSPHAIIRRCKSDTWKAKQWYFDPM